MPPGIIKNLRRLRQKMQKDGQKLCITHHQNVAKNRAEIHNLGAKGVPKSVRIVSRSAPKAILEASRFWDPQKMPTPAARHIHLGTIWVILGAVLTTARRQGIPKSSVLAPGMRQNLKI